VSGRQAKALRAGHPQHSNPQQTIRQLRAGLTVMVAALGEQLTRTDDRILDEVMNGLSNATFARKPLVGYVGAWSVHKRIAGGCDCKGRMRRSPRTDRWSERCLRWSKRSLKKLVRMGVLRVAEPSRHGGRLKGFESPGRAHGYEPGPLWREYLGWADPKPVSRPVPSVRVDVAPKPAPAVPHLVPTKALQPLPAPHGPRCVCERCMAKVTRGP
jgi:hypothetical protein